MKTDDRTNELLAAVNVDRYDTLPRLVYADYLDELEDELSSMAAGMIRRLNQFDGSNQLLESAEVALFGCPSKWKMTKSEGEYKNPRSVSLSVRVQVGKQIDQWPLNLSCIDFNANRSIFIRNGFIVGAAISTQDWHGSKGRKAEFRHWIENHPLRDLRLLSFVNMPSGYQMRSGYHLITKASVDRSLGRDVFDRIPCNIQKREDDTQIVKEYRRWFAAQAALSVAVLNRPGPWMSHWHEVEEDMATINQQLYLDAES